jgi:DNA phosphorothioation-dependent restriction protein DptH
MSNFVTFLAEDLKQSVSQSAEDLKQSVSQSLVDRSNEKLRLVYSAPPFPVLEEMFSHLAREGELLELQVEEQKVRLHYFLLDDRCTDPQGVVSARCGQNYLNAIRNAVGTFIALKDCRESLIRGLATTTNSVGIPGEIQVFGDWRGMQLIERLTSMILSKFFDREKKRNIASNLLKLSLEEAWDLDDRYLDRRHAWGVLRRLCDIDAADVTPADAFLAILGFPSCRNSNEYGSRSHTNVLARLGDLLDQLGFCGTFDILSERADQSVKEHLHTLLNHLLVRCSTPQEFLAAPLMAYSPFGDEDGGDLPDWWKALDLTEWERLLDSGGQPGTGLQVECLGDRIPKAKGMPDVFLGVPRFGVSIPEETATMEVRVSRACGRKQLEESTRLQASEPVDWTDPSEIPEHDPYLRYRFEHDKHKPVTLNVIALDYYSPGVALYCRSASKVTPFKLNKKARDDRKGEKIERYEAELRVNGVGSHQLDLYFRSGAVLGDSITGHEVNSEHGDEVVRRISLSNGQHAVCVIETDEECHYDFDARLPDRHEPAKFRIWISAADHTPTGAWSEFDSLILQNMEAGANTRVEAVPSRLGDLSIWAMESLESFHPVVIGPDYLDNWSAPCWIQRPVLSLKKLILDPRPEPGAMVAPDAFMEARARILGILRRAGGQDMALPMESHRLGEMVSDVDFAEALGCYIDTYCDWLKTSPSAACWVDLVALHDIEPEGDTLNPIPYACLLTPLHPLRLGWQCRAQAVLKRALEEHARCPAASMLDPGHFPDCMVLHCMTATGRLLPKGFISVSSSSDYWGVLWNCERISEISGTHAATIFTPAFGLEIHGLQTGFSVQQVVRSLVEVERLSAAKSTLRVGVMSDTTGSSSCNEGIEAWALERLGDEGDEWFAGGGRSLHVHDRRDPVLQPEGSALASIVNGVSGKLSWFNLHGRDGEQPPCDLTVVAHLGTANPSFQSENLHSPVDCSFLYRRRLRKQLATNGGRFIAESRVGRYPAVEEDGLGAKVGKCASLLEQACKEHFDSYLFAPRLHTLEVGLRHARYCAVSSSNVDAPCFFDGTRSSYLWDYDLPSYGRKAGENSGYFLLAKESPTMIRAVQSACKAIAPTSEISKDKVESMLGEVSRRGMPTLKKLTVGGSASLGELGMLVALRLLQSEFEESPACPGIAPVQVGGAVLNLVVPVDPFQNHFENLRAALNKGGGERPDLLVVSIRFEDGEPVAAKVTPLEVKARSGVMNATDRKAALGQAKSFAGLIKSIQNMGQKHELWGIAWRGLIVSWIDYAFRVYGQLDQFLRHSDWAKLHEEVLAAVMSGVLQPEVDERGRLVVVDLSSTSGPVDVDGDGFHETIALNHPDGYSVLNSTHGGLVGGIVALLGDWELLPHGDGRREVMLNLTLGDQRSSAVAIGADETEKAESLSRDKPGVPKHGKLPETNDTLTAMSGSSTGALPTAETSSVKAGQEGLKFKVGSVKDAFQSRDVAFFPANTQLNQLNVGIVGDLGTGKTQLIQAFIHQLRANPSQNRGTAPRILIFDYKKDYSKPAFVEATGARVVKPFDIPLSLFDTRDSSNPERAWLDRSKFFTDVLDKIFSGIGPVQRQKIKEAVKSAYASTKDAEPGFPTLEDVFAAYAEAAGDKVDSPYAIMSDLVDGAYFTSDRSKVQQFSSFLDGVVVVDLGAVGQDDRTKNMLVAIFLNLFYEHMLTIEKKPFIGADPQLRHVEAMLLVDEADNIMKYEFDVLKKVLLQGREFGVGVMLASQYLSHFKTSNENYVEPLLTWLVHKVPNITVRELESLGLPHVDSNMAQRIKSLECHECLYKTFDVDGQFIRATPFYELMNQPGMGVGIS